MDAASSASSVPPPSTYQHQQPVPQRPGLRDIIQWLPEDLSGCTLGPQDEIILYKGQVRYMDERYHRMYFVNNGTLSFVAAPGSAQNNCVQAPHQSHNNPSGTSDIHQNISGGRNSVNNAQGIAPASQNVAHSSQPFTHGPNDDQDDEQSIETLQHFNINRYQLNPYLGMTYWDDKTAVDISFSEDQRSAFPVDLSEPTWACNSRTASAPNGRQKARKLPELQAPTIHSTQELEKKKNVRWFPPYSHKDEARCLVDCEKWICELVYSLGLLTNYMDNGGNEIKLISTLETNQVKIPIKHAEYAARELFDYCIELQRKDRLTPPWIDKTARTAKKGTTTVGYQDRQLTCEQVLREVGNCVAYFKTMARDVLMGDHKKVVGGPMSQAGTKKRTLTLTNES